MLPSYAVKRLGHEAIHIECVDVDDEGEYWTERCQASLRAVRVCRLVVAPPWDVPAHTPDTSVIVIHPPWALGLDITPRPASAFERCWINRLSEQPRSTSPRDRVCW